MKNKKYILLLLIVIGAAFYIYVNSIATINEQNFKEMSIQNFDVKNADQYQLSETSKASLFEALTAIEGATIDKNIDSVHEFQMFLTNRWGVSWEYRVYYAEDMTVYLQLDADNVYAIEKPDFFYNHEWFYDIYNDRIASEIQISVNEIEVPFQYLDNSWNFLRHDNHWVSLQPAILIPGEDQEYVSIASADDPMIVITEKQPDNARLIIRNRSTDSVILDEEVEIDNLPYPNSNGQFDYELRMEWNDATKLYQGQYTVGFTVTLDLPERFQFSKQQLIQGDILEIVVGYVTNPEDIYLEQSIFKDFRWYIHDDILRAYIPTNYNTKTDVYEIKYGNRKTGTEKTLEIEVIAHDYRIQRLYVNKSIEQATRNEAAYTEFAKYFTPVRKQSAPTRYYIESFVIPAKGRLTSEFGQTRYVNDAPTSSRHSGLDIAAPTGTEIVATNRGKVVLSMPLILTGNTVVIDHGEGLFSVYYHMHEFFVEEGDVVERGQKIATIGSTGFSTGPHLHFTMSYYTMNIDPGFFLVGQPITFANYQEFLQ